MENLINIEYLTAQAERWIKRSPRTKKEIQAYMESLWNALDSVGHSNSINKALPVEKALYKLYDPTNH